jgi:hypothetical protein
MKLHDFRIGWRMLRQEPAWSAVVIGGLAIGFAACFLLLGYVRYSLSYNGTVPQADRVYLVKQRINVFPRPEYAADAGLPLRDVALRSGLVQQAVIARELDAPMAVGTRLQRVTLLAVDPALPALFGIRAVDGDVAAALSRPDGLALTLDTARKLFGHSDVLGQRVLVSGATLTVRALLPEPPANSTLRYAALTGSASSAWPERQSAFERWQRGQVYIKLKPGASSASLRELLQRAVNDSPRDSTWRASAMGKQLNGRNVTDIAVRALPDLYFDSDLASGRDGANYGRKDSLFGLAAVALLILLLAATNYVNLATVRTLRRRRETGVRKLLGADPARLVRMFLAESVLVALLATALGLVLAWLLLPLFGELLGRRLEGFFSPASCATALLFGAATGVAAGLYPALIALRVRPADALTGRAGSETAGGLWLRRALTVLQFASAMALTGTTLAIVWQTDYASHADPGFNPRGLLVLDLPAEVRADHGFVTALARLPGVAGVATVSEAVGRDGTKIIGGFRMPNGDGLRIELKNVSPGFFDVYGIKPLAGRLFDPATDKAGSVAVINASAALMMGYSTPEAAIGHTLTPGQPELPLIRVVGVAPELRYRTLRQAPEPMLYLVNPGAVVTLRSGDSAAVAYDRILPLWRRYFPNAVLEVRGADSFFALNYADDRRLAGLLGGASLIAIALAAFGIYVLAAYSVQRRTREIVLRKLYGAGAGAIARLVGREFAALLALGALVGLPLAGVAMHRYLADYVERAPMGIWPLLAAFGLALLVALAATARHTLAAVRIAPVEALRQ